MKRIWHYATNQLLVVSRGNFKRTIKLSRQHIQRLKKAMDANPGDLDYAKAYNRYLPLHQALEAAYANWQSKGGLQKGDTLNLIQLLSLLPAKINKIDVKIQAFHDKGSQRWTQLFPRAHKPFYEGTQDTKMDAVNTLIASIGTEADLAPVKLTLQGIFTELIAAKGEQTGEKAQKATGSSDLETAGYNAMVMQYRNVGLFIDKFPEEPEKICAMFDVESICNPEQTIWKGRLDFSEKEAMMIHTFEAGDMIRGKSVEGGGFMLYLASTPGGTDSEKVVIEEGREWKFDVSEFHVTDYSVNRYLTIINMSDNKETRYLIELY